MQIKYTIRKTGREKTTSQVDVGVFINSAIRLGGLEENIERLNRIVARLLLRQVQDGVIPPPELVELLEFYVMDPQYEYPDTPRRTP